MPYSEDETGRRRRHDDHDVHLADGRTMRLSIGEYHAVQAWIRDNARSGYLMPPRNSTAVTTARLIELGLIAWVRPGVARWCPGVLELTDPIDREPVFSFAGRAKG